MMVMMTNNYSKEKALIQAILSSIKSDTSLDAIVFFQAGD